MNNKLKMTFGYEGTDFIRNMTISNIDDSLTSGIKAKIQAVNASLTGGTSGGLAEESTGIFCSRIWRRMRSLNQRRTASTAAR